MRAPHSSRARGRLVAAVATTTLIGSVVASTPAALAATTGSTTSATTVLTLTSKTTTGLPATVAPGWHTFVLSETAAQLAKDPRGITVLRFAKGYTLATFKKDIAASFADKPNLKDYARLTKNTVSLGGLDLEKDFTATATRLTVALTAGSYFIDNGASDEGAADNYTAMTVAGTAVGAKPATVGTITSKEYGYKIVGARKGLHMYALHDAGVQIHMYVIFRLDKGHTEAELETALSSNGPPPAWVHNGGYAGVVTPGQTMYTTLNLSPNSNYELICFMPDLKTGAPHFTLGMHRFFSVS